MAKQLHHLFSVTTSCLLLALLTASSVLIVSAEQCRFEITVKTGTIEDAGTDARVSLQVSDGGAGPALMIPNLESYGAMYEGRDYFENGNLDIFGITAPCMASEPCSMVIWSDGSGNKPGWYLDYVKVTQLGGRSGSITHKWPVGQWLAADEPPHTLSAARNGCGLKEQYQ